MTPNYGLDMYFSVDTNNPHTVVENQTIDPIGFQDPFQNGTTTWTVSLQRDLPADVVMDPNTGEITGSVNGVSACQYHIHRYCNSWQFR